MAMLNLKSIKLVYCEVKYMVKDYKVLVCIYGIGRSVEYTANSITNLIDKVRLRASDVHVTYLLSKQDCMKSFRTGEFGFIPDVPYGIFKEDTRSEAFISSDEYQEILSFLKRNTVDLHSNNFVSYENLLKQLTMLERIYYSVNISNYSHVLFLRDDVIVEISDKYLDLMMCLNHDEIFTSSYYWNNGLCDRFLFLRSRSAEKLMLRKNDIKDLIFHGGFLTGERLIKYVAKTNGLHVISRPFKLTRIRLKGKASKERHMLPFWRPVELFNVVKSIFGSCK